MMDFQNLDAYWRAANYLTVGQIYLQDNPLLRDPLGPEHIKPRLLGHWGPPPGQTFISVHLNRLIRETDANVIYLAGPGHGGPAIVANVYLEGTYSDIYPDVSQDAAGMQRLFRQFSTPGGIPSHVSVPTPGSIHEGGELGYVSATPSAPPSTTRTCSSSRWWATARRRPGPWPGPGRARASSIRRAMAPSCPSCTSTAIRSPTRRCWGGQAMPTWAPCSPGMATRSTSSKPTIHRARTRSLPPRWTPATARSARSSRTPARTA